MTLLSLKAPTETHTETSWQTVHRVVFPADSDPTVLPLYVNWGAAISAQGATRLGDRDLFDGARKAPVEQVPSETQVTGVAGPTLGNRGRRSAVVPAHERASFGTYFNAFPAGYWRQWTTVDRVRLVVDIEGEAVVDVYRSTARGTFNRIAGTVDEDGHLSFDIALDKFGDGGWLWFEIEALGSAVRLNHAEWLVPTDDGVRDTKVSVAITTYNRPDDCVAQMRRFAQSPDLLQRLDQLIITDQGTKHVEDADGFSDAAEALGDQFRLVHQGNLGGSGGFARGMYEGSRNADTDYVMLLDDDVLVETEGILRAVNFADFTRTPTIVGGHMLNLYERSMLHSYGEHINQYRFMWGPVNPELEAFDFARHSLRTTAALHKRMDVDYNGWWMCLIPRTVIEQIGLALPLFIKWDDSEYGLRAKKAGIPSVSLPGAAVWHMPWTEKDDRLDWQAYFHQRNRWVVALLYSEYPKGGALPRESFAADVKHLLSLQYSPVVLRNWALRDVLAGPAHLHATLGTRTQQVRKLQKEFPDGAVIKDIDQYPKVKRRKLLRRGEEPTPPRGRVVWAARAALALARQFRKVDPEGVRHPEERVAAVDAQWWRLSQVDSALVSTADGTGVSWYKRDTREFRKLLVESEELHLALFRHWDELREQYRRAFPQLVDSAEWEKTFKREV